MPDFTEIRAGKNWARLYRGDCLEVLPTLGKVDAVITDPPYGTQDLAGGYGRRQNWDIGDGLGRVIENDHDLSALETCFPLLNELVTTGWLMVFYAPRKTREFVAATSKGDWFGEVIWDKGAPGLGYHIRYSHENIAVFRRGEPARPKDALLSLLRHPTIADDHPHEKPLPVIQRLANWAACPGQAIIDPFMGSGTTGVAALRHGCNFIGIEIEPKYFEIAKRRIQAEAAQRKMAFTTPEGA